MKRLVIRLLLVAGTLHAADHPRLLFKPGEEESIRRRMGHPQLVPVMKALDAMLQQAEDHGFAFHGPAAEHSMGPVWATGHAWRYRFGGDPAEAQRAAELCRDNLFGNYYYGGGWLHPYTLMGLALSYDLCDKAWDPAFRALAFAFLERNVRELAGTGEPDHLAFAERYDLANPQADFKARGPGDARAAQFRAAAAIAALAILGDVPPLDTPVPPAEAPRLPPADDYHPWIGVPIVPFESGKMPSVWLVNGPFRRGEQEAAMQAIGGMADARPEPGTVLMSDGVAVDFRRYHPNRQPGKESPFIYARNCNRYWTGSTGGGYRPGLALARRWRDTSGHSPAINVVLYTVISNTAPRIVQACPNWQSRSHGARMWLNGRPLADGQLARLEPGLYPLLVDVPLVGGYSSQAPHLREYTEEDYARDLHRMEETLPRYADPAADANPVRQCLDALLQYVFTYVETEVGPDDAWEVWDTQETLLPLLYVLQRTGGNLPPVASRLSALLPLATALRGHWNDRAMDYLVSQGTYLVPESQQPLARWYLDHYGHGLKRPIECLFAVLQHPVDIHPVPPTDVFTRWRTFPSHGVTVLRSGWDGSRDGLLVLHAGSARTSPWVPGIGLWRAFGHPWLQWRTGERYEESNVLEIEGVVPARPADVLIFQPQADGSGMLTFEQPEFAERNPGQPGGVKAKGRQRLPVAVRRTIAVDWSDPDTPLLAMADILTGTHGLQKTWRYDLGFAGFADPVRPEPSGFRFTPPGNGRHADTPKGASMHGTIVADGKVEFRKPRYDKGSRLLLEVILERRLSEVEQAAQRAGIDRSGGDDTLDTLLDGFDAEQAAETREAGGRLTVLTVLTLRPDDQHPAVDILQRGDAPAVQVGARIVRFDGQRIEIAPRR